MKITQQPTGGQRPQRKSFPTHLARIVDAQLSRLGDQRAGFEGRLLKFIPTLVEQYASQPEKGRSLTVLQERLICPMAEAKSLKDLARQFSVSIPVIQRIENRILTDLFTLSHKEREGWLPGVAHAPVLQRLVRGVLRRWTVPDELLGLLVTQAVEEIRAQIDPRAQRVAGYQREEPLREEILRGGRVKHVILNEYLLAEKPVSLREINERFEFKSAASHEAQLSHKISMALGRLIKQRDDRFQ